MNSIPRLSAHLALLGLSAALTACGGSTSSGVADARPATRPMGGAAMLQQVRSAGEVGDELDVQPLRDPRVEDLRASATQAESRGDYAGASRLLAQAAQFTPNDPDLLQWQAELALVERDWTGAERLATQSWDHGPKLGGLCRRNWATIRLSREMRGLADAAATAGSQAQRCTVEPPVRM